MNDNQKRLVEKMVIDALTKVTANRNYTNLTDLLIIARDMKVEGEIVDSSLNVLRDYMMRQVCNICGVDWFEAICFLFGGGNNLNMDKFKAQGYRDDIYDIQFFALCHISTDMLELTCG